MRIEQTPEERSATISLLKAGMNKMLEAAKQGLRFAVITEEIEAIGRDTNVNNQ